MTINAQINDILNTMRVVTFEEYRQAVYFRRPIRKGRWTFYTDYPASDEVIACSYQGASSFVWFLSKTLSSLQCCEQVIK